MKTLAAAAIALTLALGSAASAQCIAPIDDATEIKRDHGKDADYLLEGDKAKDFAKKTGAPEEMLPLITHIQMWLLPSGTDYMVAFYIGGCRAGAFAMSVDKVISNVSVYKPMPFIAVLRLRGA